MPEKVRRSLVAGQGSAGWRLTFKYAGRGANIDLELEGSDQAIRFGLGMAGLLLGEQIQKRLGVEDVPEGLLLEGLMVSGFQSGVPLVEFKGKFLRVEPVAKVSGLMSSVHVQWGD
jgi:hypothetical protein